MLDYEEDQDQSQDQEQPPLPPGAQVVPAPGAQAMPPLPPGAQVVPASPGMPQGSSQFGFPKGTRQYSREEMDKAFRDAASQGGTTFVDYLPSIIGTGAVLAAGQPELLPAMGWGATGAGAGSLIKQGIQGLQGEPPEDVPTALYNTGKDMMWGAGGELGGRALTAPFELGGMIAKKWINPESLYQSALRPSITLGEPGVKRVVRTGLKEAIPVSEKGLAKVHGITDDLNQQIAGMIQKRSDELGAVIDPRKVAKTGEEIKPLFSRQVNPNADLNAIDSSVGEFVDKWQNKAPYTQIAPHPSYGVDPSVPPFYKVGEGETATTRFITPAEAQAEKQGTYIQLRKKYGELGNADVEAQKGLARGLKEQIEVLFPDVAKLRQINARDSALIELDEQLSRQVARAGNLNVMPLTTGIVAGAGMASGHAAPAVAFGLLKKIIDDPALKSKLAIAIYKGSIAGLKTGRAVGSGITRAVGATHDLRQGKETVLDSNPDYQFARGGRVGYADGDLVQDDGSDDEVLRDIYQRGMLRLSRDPGQFDPEPRPKMGPPQAAPQAPPRFQDPVAGFLGRSADQMSGGWQNLWEPSNTTAADPAWWDKKAQAASDVIRGASPFLAPLAIPAAVAAPGAAVAGLAAGMGATTGTEALAKKAGVSPGRAALIADLTGGVAGAVAGSVYPRPKPAGVVPEGTLNYEQAAARPVDGGPEPELPAPTQGSSGSLKPQRPPGNSTLQRVANDYAGQAGLPPIDHSQYHPLDENFGRRVADAYEALQGDNSADPRVRAAYEALVRETKAQYDHLVSNGYQLEPWTQSGQPYRNSHEMVADLKNNKHLYFFSGGEPHPFMDAIDPDTGLSMTEIFRGVHDVHGHAGAGYGFGARGEEGAFDIHSQMYSPLARQALASETRGQNSWVNFGRHNYDAQGNDLHIPATEKPYAQQKVDLLPPELHERAGARLGGRSAVVIRKPASANLQFNELPEYAQRSLMDHSMQVQTNEKLPDPYDIDKGLAGRGSVQFERTTVPIRSLKDANHELFVWDWPGFRGSQTKGPIVLSHSGEIIDGNNRVYEAIKRGEQNIEAYRPARDPGYAKGGKVGYYDGDLVQTDGSDDEELRRIYREGLKPPATAPDPAAEAALDRGPAIEFGQRGTPGDTIQLGAHPGDVDFRRQPIQIDPERAKQELFGDYKPSPEDTGEATISAQPSPGLGERLVAPFRDSQFGHAFGIDTRTEATRAQEDQGWNTPLVRFENAIPEQGIPRDVAQMASGFTTPKSMGIMALTGGFGQGAPGMASQIEGQLFGTSLLSNLINAGFSVSMIKSAYDQIPQAKEAWERGDYETMKRILAQMTVSTGLGVMAGQGAFHNAPTSGMADVHVPEPTWGLGDVPQKLIEAGPGLRAAEASARGNLQSKGAFQGATLYSNPLANVPDTTKLIASEIGLGVSNAAAKGRLLRAYLQEKLGGTPTAGEPQAGAQPGALEPDTLRMLQIHGAQKILAGYTDPNAWAQAMVHDLGQGAVPHLDDLWEGAQSIADQAGKNVKARTMDTLDTRIPDEQRVVSPTPTTTTGGQPFHTLDLAQPSEGFLPFRKYGEQAADQLEQRMLQEAVQESEAGGGTTAADAVRSTGLRLPGSRFWDESFSLPQRARFWYELSGEAFTNKYMDVPREFQPAVIDAVAGTSGGVEPGDNLERAIGILSENLQKQPVMTDLRDQASARKALDPQQQAEKTLKYGSFSGTMQYTAGLTPKAPLTTNDVQVASMFGIKGTDLGKNPVLYEVLSRFYQKMRDAQNAELGIQPIEGGGWHNPHGAQPWETWQMQAPSWVQERIRKNPLKASQYDDYSQVFPSIIKKLQDAGIPTPNGKITMETLMDPRTPNVMSGTRQQFLDVPHATVEIATDRTVRGARAAAMAERLKGLDQNEPWVRKATAAYEQVQRNIMQDLAKRRTIKKGASMEDIADLTKMPMPAARPEETPWVPNYDESYLQDLYQKAATAKDGVTIPSVISQLMSHILGQKVDVSRLDWEGLGTYLAQVNPNLRIPMGGTKGGKTWIALNDIQREAFLALLGRHLDQDAMAASHFEIVPHSEADTYSVFVNRYDGHLNPAEIQAFRNRVGYEVNVKQHANGTMININKGKAPMGPSQQTVIDAAHATFGGDDNVQMIGVIANRSTSNFVPREEYGAKINAHARAEAAAQSKAVKPGGRSPLGPPATRAGDFQRVQNTVRRIARERDAQLEAWRREAEATYHQRVGPNPPTSAPPP